MGDMILEIWKWVGIALLAGSVVAVLFFALIGALMFANYRK